MVDDNMKLETGVSGSGENNSIIERSLIRITD